MIFILARAVTYASLFIGFLLIFLPGRVLERWGMVRPAGIGPIEVLGLVIGVAGAALALWCILTFAVIGRGTPAPFDPPRRLVVAGPYRYLRNPMYLGAAFALLGAAVFYRSSALALYTVGFLLVTHLFVLLYEEPALTRTFGQEYQNYRGRVRRWLPRTPA
jgi:protein-S-isoprenylcysteine O-methyltransferase Ste14